MKSRRAFRPPSACVEFVIPGPLGRTFALSSLRRRQSIHARGWRLRSDNEIAESPCVTKLTRGCRPRSLRYRITIRRPTKICVRDQMDSAGGKRRAVSVTKLRPSRRSRFGDPPGAPRRAIITNRSSARHHGVRRRAPSCRPSRRAKRRRNDPDGAFPRVTRPNPAPPSTLAARRVARRRRRRRARRRRARERRLLASATPSPRRRSPRPAPPPSPTSSIA